MKKLRTSNSPWKLPIFRKADATVARLQHSDFYVTHNSKPRWTILQWVQLVMEHTTALPSSTLLTFGFALFCWATCLYLGLQIWRRLYGLERTNRFPRYVPLMIKNGRIKARLTCLQWYLFMLQRSMGDKYNIPGHRINGFTVFKVATDYYIELLNAFLRAVHTRVLYVLMALWDQVKLFYGKIFAVIKVYISYRIHRYKLFTRFKRRILNSPKDKKKK